MEAQELHPIYTLRVFPEKTGRAGVLDYASNSLRFREFLTRKCLVFLGGRCSFPVSVVCSFLEDYEYRNNLPHQPFGATSSSSSSSFSQQIEIM